MGSFLYYWIDVIWIPVLFFGVHKHHRWWALGFVVGTVILVHTQSELMQYIGHPYGIMGLWEVSVHTRLLIVSGFFYILFLVMAHFSPRTEGVIFMAASLSIFFMVFLCGSLAMLL